MKPDRQKVIGWVIIGAIILLAVRNVRLSWDTVILICLLAPTVIFHEVAHGAVAYLFGDNTAKNAGRLTLNPIKHIDPLGTIALPLMLLLANLPPFGYAKPVPVSLNNLRNPRTHALLVGLAGPATNLLLAALSVVFIGMLWSPQSGGTDILKWVYAFGVLNIFIAVFNLLPIPPLDGSSILEFFLPLRWKPGYYAFRRYAMIGLLVIVLAQPVLLGNVLRTMSHPFMTAYDRGVSCVTRGCVAQSPTSNEQLQ